MENYSVHFALCLQMSAILILGIFGLKTRVYKTKSLRVFGWVMFTAVVACLTDAFSHGMFPEGTPVWLQYMVLYVNWICGDLMLMILACYGYHYIREHTEVNKWLFFAPILVLAVGVGTTIVAGVQDKIFVEEDGIVECAGTKPLFASICDLIFIPYIVIVVGTKHRQIGWQAVLLMAMCSVLPLMTYLFKLLYGGIDYSYLVAGFSVIVINIFMGNTLARDKVSIEQEKQQRYHDVISRVGRGVWSIIIAKGKAPRMECDDKMKQIMGIAPDSQMTPEQIYDYWYGRVTPEALPTVQASVAKMMDGKFDENTYLWTHPEQGDIYVRCGGMCEFLPDGSYKLSGYHGDVTKIVMKDKIHEQELRKAREDAEAASAAKTSFLFNMSHDIRTPMNAIMGFTKLLLTHLDDEEKSLDYIRKIENSSNVLLSIINNVLEMARIEKGTIEIEEKPFGAKAFNDTLFNVFDELMQQKGIAFTREINVEHHNVLCDPTKLREVFYNVLSNAYKYTNPGGKVHMKLEEITSTMEGFAMYKTTISDTGIGMSKEYLPHIFDEFSREHNTTQNKIEGTGLGMPIVKRLVELMNGSISVESELGKGSKFVIIIPHRINPTPVEEEKVVEVSDIESLEGKRILLAEDNDLNAEIVIEILQEVGYEIERAENGKVCVEMMQQKPAGYYDVILMDVQMPEMDGYEATRQVRAMEDQAKSGIPILAMTANAFEEDKRNATRAGMNGHIAKPINVSELMKELALALTPANSHC